MVEIFKALAEESRLRILSLLLENDMCVCEIENCLSLKQSNISRHLSNLKASGILESYKKAQWSYYKINNNFIQENQELWVYLEKRLKELPSYQEDYKKMKKCKSENICNCLI
ncbi:MAG: metalloregulator ArsR/SmtB family transcription factor [Sphaerochaetaceae bacterium]|nr:metalloregulator ArsR/SmtB family transcription factor [Sphaerochaetaceae bacterium]MDC7238705.1 metalloregulator ArsR/SmtB family transcription factor [Sphaerochaetaceae bacterium]